MTNNSLPKVAFVLSVVTLAFLAGQLTHRFGWFPTSLVERAYRQGRAVLADPGGEDPQAPDFLERRVYDRAGVRLVEPDRMQPGLTLITTRWKDSRWLPGLKLVDRHGEVLHRWRVDPAAHFTPAQFRRGIELRRQDLHGSHLFPNGDVLVNVEYAGTLRLDACGRVRWKLARGGHHSIHRAADGSFWIPVLSHPAPDTSRRYPGGFPGLEGPIYHPGLMRVSAGGEVRRVIDLLEVLYDNGLADELEKRFHPADPVHTNDVEPLPPALADAYPRFEAGDLLVSLRDANLVLILDPDTRRVRWHASGPFRLQHDPDFLGDGRIGIFDNNWDGEEDPRTPADTSRIVALRPGSGTGAADVLFPTARSEPFFTAHRGKWQRLANGNLLLAEADAGRVVEVAPDGRTVWEWIAEPYDETHVPGVSNAVRHDLSRAEVAAWPCSPGEDDGR